MAGDCLRLSSAIQSLRDELIEAQAMGEGSDVRFSIEDITLELTVVASAKAGAGGKVGWSLFGATANVEANAEAAASRSHKIQLKMKLAPGAAGNDTLISDSDSPPPGCEEE
jgi:hypothetical protein